MAALKKNCFHLRMGNCCTFACNFDLIFCICFKAGDQKMRPCAFICFFLCKFAAGYGGQLPRPKSDKRCRHQEK